MRDITITLPSEQWEKIQQACWWYNDCGDADDDWQSKELSEASSALCWALFCAGVKDILVQMPR